MIIRMILQFCRLGLSLIRVKETNIKRKAAAEDLNLEFSIKTAEPSEKNSEIDDNAL